MTMSTLSRPGTLGLHGVKTETTPRQKRPSVRTSKTDKEGESLIPDLALLSKI